MSARQIALLILAVLPAAPIAADSDADTLVFSSGAERMTVIELYTSEGCSSCPPADRWLSTLKTHPALWQQVVPLAFHVDYWDYIGWRDRFARPEFSRRQRGYAREAAVSSVYTPGVFRNGREWLGWRRGGPVTPDSRPEVGNLTLSVDDDVASLEFSPSGRSLIDVEAHVAVIGMGLETRVRAGENAGKKLRHDFVVLEVIPVDLDRAAGSFRGSARLPRGNEDAASLAVVAWISERKSLAPVQAAGGMLQKSQNLRVGPL